MRQRIHFPQRFLAIAVLGAFLLSLGSFAPYAAPAATAAAVDPQVLAEMAAAPDGQATFLVYLRDRADLSRASQVDSWAERGQDVMERLQATARASQAALLDRLAQRRLPGHVSSYQPFWIANVIVVTGDRRAAEWLARQPGVAAVLPELKLDPPELPDAGPAAAAAPDAVPYGIDKINANDVWSVYGVRGEGAVVGLVDTGVQWDHPALKGHYRGWNGSTADHNFNWWDPANFCGAAGSPPCDTNGHGTHTTGTTTGGTGVNEIGVAPGAKWIHAAGCCASNASLLSSLQWMLAPTDMNGNNANPALRPNVVNNSWGGPGGSQIYYDVIESLRAAGVVPVFSAGNNGNACGTLGSPGDNLVAFNVGATDSSDAIADFSSRGSNPFNGLTDPDVTAPGDNVWSSVPGNGYNPYSGTSMAAPHVAGSVALIMSAEPDLVGKVDQVEELLRKTAQPLTTGDQTCGGVPGTQVPNNTFGWGRIDVKAAVDFVWHAGTLSGVVTDAGTGLPIAGAAVSITRNSKTLTQRAAADGSYSFVAGAGTYSVQAVAFGYAAQTASNVSVSQDVTTARDFVLGTLSAGSISGTVTQSGGATPVAGATVALVGTALSAVTAADGTYALVAVPFGAHTARMTSPGFQTLSAAVTVDGAETLNFSPAAVPDYVIGDGGDTCSAEFAWIDATSGGAHSLGDDAYTSVTLPWAFPFYGTNYNAVYISSNGFVSFGQGYSKWHGIIPFEGVPNNQIIGMGEDLNPENGTQGVIYTKDLGDGRFVIEYHQVEHWASGDPETFEIILNNNDDTILVQYQTVSWPDFANAGIENADGSRGILYSYANNPPLTAGLAVKYTPFSGQAPVCTPAAAPVISIAADGAKAVLSWPHQPPDTAYQVWRDTLPYFLPAGEGTLVDTLAATGGPMTFDDPNRVGNPDVNHFWVVRGVLAGGASGPSNRVGEFDFALVRGQ